MLARWQGRWAGKFQSLKIKHLCQDLLKSIPRPSSRPLPSQDHGESLLTSLPNPSLPSHLSAHPLPQSHCSKK